MKKRLLLTVCLIFILSGLAGAVPDGIYRDVVLTGDPSDAKYALYIQTYETQGIVAVLLDNSGGVHKAEQRLYAFVGPDYTMGLDQDDIGGADAHLTLSAFSNDNTAGAVFTAGGVAAAFSIYRWIESPDLTYTALNAIYKDQPLGGPTPLFNLYFQTYGNVTPPSAIAIVTDDSAVSLYAHVDENLDDGFSAFDQLKGEAHLSLTFAEAGTDVEAVFAGFPMGISDKNGDFIFTPPEGDVVSGEFYRHFQAPALEVIF